MVDALQAGAALGELRRGLPGREPAAERPLDRRRITPGRLAVAGQDVELEQQRQRPDAGGGQTKSVTLIEIRMGARYPVRVSAERDGREA